MKCPECGAWSTVLSTRESPDHGFVRRRECANLHRFTTQEMFIPAEKMIARRNERLRIHNNQRKENAK